MRQLLAPPPPHTHARTHTRPCCISAARSALAQIVEVNNILRQGLEKGLPIVNLMENWDFLQVGGWGVRVVCVWCGVVGVGG